jgi:cytochrome c556
MAWQPLQVSGLVKWPAGGMRDKWLRKRKESNMKRMKHQCLLVTVLAVSALAVGCNQPEDSTSENREATAKQLDKIKAETKQAAQDMKDYAYAQKTQFVDEMQARLADINKDLDQLSAKIEKSTDAVKAEAAPKLQALRDQTATLKKQLDQARNATESTWADLQAHFKKDYGELKDKFQQARRWLSDKIAP